MKPDSSKVCPACGTRNKAKWEFCVRCGESLQAVSVSDDAPAAKAPDIRVDDVVEERSPAATVLFAILMLALVAGIVVWILRTPTEQTVVQTTAFQLPVTPSNAPSRAPTPAGPADADSQAGQRLLAAGNGPAAAQAFARALEKAPDDPQLHSLYAQALSLSGQRDEALRHFEDAARLSPQVGYRLGFAAALNLAGRNQDAIEQYQQVLTQDPREQQALKELGSLLNRMNRFDDAIPYLTRAVEVNPADLALLQDLAWAHEAKGNLDQAAETYRQVLAAGQTAAVSRARLAEVLLKQQKTAEALAVVEEGLQKAPATPLLRRARASLLERSGRIAEAIAEYREYARIAPNSDDARMVTERANLLEKRAAGGSSL
jgi:tetratricopeptide (TPR) repeat protein